MILLLTSLTLLVVFAAAHCYVLLRVVPFRKDLLEGAVGFERFTDFISRSWLENYSTRYYKEPAHNLIPWVRATAALAVLALWAVVFSAVALSVNG